MTGVVGGCWTAPLGNRYVVGPCEERKSCASPPTRTDAKVRALSTTVMQTVSSRDFSEVKRPDSSSEAKTAISSAPTLPRFFDDSVENDRLRTAGIELLKPFDELSKKTGRPICPARMSLSKFVEWLQKHAEALNECARGAAQADTITEIFKRNLTDRGEEILPLIPGISIAKGQKRGDFPTILLVPFNECNYYKNEMGYFSEDAMPEVDEAKQRVLTSKEEVDAIVIEAAKSAGMMWGYTRDGCEYRARILYQALRCMGIAKKNIFLQYYVGHLNRFDWGFHVALAIKLANGQLLVLDPSFDSKASMTVENWIRKFHDDENYQLTTNHLLDVGKSGIGAFHTSCDHALLFNDSSINDSANLPNESVNPKLVIKENGNFFEDFSNRAGLHSVILQLMNSLAKSRRLLGLLQEVWAYSQLLWLPSLWPKFMRLNLFDIKTDDAEAKLVFNFSLEEINALNWRPEFGGIGFSVSEAILRFEQAIASCTKEIRLWDAQPQSNPRTKQALQSYIDELSKKLSKIAWPKFMRLNLFDIETEGAKALLVFNFTLEDIKALNWLPEFARIGFPKSKAITRFEQAIASCNKKIRLEDAQSEASPHIKQILQNYINELSKKLSRLKKT